VSRSYDEHVHAKHPLGDPSKRAFTYFVLTGGRFIYASALRVAVLKFILSMTVRRSPLLTLVGRPFIALCQRPAHWVRARDVQAVLRELCVDCIVDLASPRRGSACACSARIRAALMPRR